MNQTLAITLQNPSGLAPRGALELEQKGWLPHTGAVSRLNMVRFLGRLLYGSDTENSWQEQANCGMVGTDMITGVYAYPSTPGLAYRIAASYGTLSEGVVEEIEEQEVISLSLEDEAQTRHPVLEILSAVPQGDLYDAAGGIVPLPAITWSGDRIRLSRKVYGSILVTYLMLRHTYVLSVPRRDPETTVENFYSSVVYAWWSGDGTWLEVETPPGAEELVEDCGWGSGTGFGDDPDPDRTRPQSAGADRSIVYDYCSGEVISDNTYETTEY